MTIVKRLTKKQKARMVREIVKKNAGSDLVVMVGEPFQSVSRSIKPLPSLGCMVPDCTGCKVKHVTLEQALKAFRRK